MSTVYEEFLRSKMVAAPERGISIDPGDINPLLKPHQAAIVRWALRKGNAAIFAAFGLGKTFMQLEIARLIQRAAGGKFLIVAPLGVRQEFRRDAEDVWTDSGRKGIACELAASYWRDACFYLEAAERQMATPNLFDLLKEPEVEEVTA